MRSVRLLLNKCNTVQGATCRYNALPLQTLQKRSQTTIAVTQQAKTAEHFDFSNAKPFDEIPSVPSLPIIGSSWVYLPLLGKYDLKQLHKANLKRYKEYGKIVRESAFGFQLVHLYDPVDIETMFRYEGRTPFRIALEPLSVYRSMRKEVFGRGGLLIMQGEDWLDYRTKVQRHMLRPKSIHAYMPQMALIADEMIQTIYDKRDENGEVPEFMNQLYKWALESVAIVAMDKKLGCLDPKLPKDSEPQKMINVVNYAFEALLDLSVKPPLWKIIPTPRWLKFVESMDFFRTTANKYINEAIERLKNTNVEDRELTVLESLLNIADFERQDAVTMVGDMLVAGIDTSSTAAAFTMYHLAKNPEAQEKVFQEICKSLPSKDTPITSDILYNIPYLQACFKETLRLKPIANGTIRRLPCDVLLSGYRVPAGTLLVSQNGTASRLEEYFSEPDSFKPERWMKETKEKFHPFVSLPFGFGPRMCVGRRIAEQEIWLLVIKVIQNFHIEYANEDLDMTTRLVNMPDKPLRFKFVPRK